MISNRPAFVRIFLVLIVAVAAGMGLTALDRWHAGSIEHHLRLERLRRVVEQTSTLELRAINERGFSPESRRKWEELHAQLRQGQSGGPAALDAGLARALERYRDAMDSELKALGSGRFDEARALDGSQVGPAFALLTGQLDDELERQAMASTDAASSRLWGSLALLLGGAVALMFLSWRYERSRRRVEAISVEQRALEQSRSFFEQLLRNSADVIITLNAAGEIEYHSPNGQQVLDAGGVSLAGRRFATLLPTEEVEGFERFLAELHTSREGASVLECDLGGAKGRHAAVELVGATIPDPAGASRVVLNIREVSSRRRIEEELRQAQKMEAVGRLAGGVAHDFNNLLTAMQGYAQLLEMELSDNPRLLRFVGEIQSSANRAGGLTRHLLAYSRKQILSLQVLDPGIIVRSMDSMLRRLIRADITLVTRVAEDVGRLKADAGQLEQVIMNLALNARDAMPKGGQLTIEAHNVTVDDSDTWAGEELPAGSYISLMVGDTGHGMPEEVRAHIFEPFFTTKPTGLGTGLGLSTVYGIVKQSGGHVTVYSEPGAGTTFKVYLPRVDDATTPMAPKSRIMTRPAPDSGTILLVEDEPQVRALLAEALATVGYTILEAEDGQKGVDVARAHAGTIDLIVTDMIMPCLNGHELVEKVRETRPGILAIYMSGHTESGILTRGILQPGLRFLQKPFKPARLLLLVREALEEARRAAAA